MVSEYDLDLAPGNLMCMHIEQALSEQIVGKVMNPNIFGHGLRAHIIGTLSRKFGCSPMDVQIGEVHRPRPGEWEVKARVVRPLQTVQVIFTVS